MAHASETNGVNGEASAAWKPSNEDPSAFSEAHEGKKLSNAEMKKLQKQEKAARRAKEKESKAPDQSKASPASSSNARQPSKQDDGRPQQKDNVPQPSRQQGHSQQRKRRESTAAQPQATGNLPLRESSGATKKAPKAVPFFAHTYNTTRRRAPESTPKDVHAEISTLALHLSTYVICGSHARGVATLLAFKSVVQSYTTPSGTSLTRHFVSHHLPPQINHLKAARPLSTTQANAIRWLKNFIAKLDPSAPEDRTKIEICDAIDTFISERFTIADRVIVDSLAAQIQGGDSVVTFGNSAVTREGLLAATSRGVQYEVTVVDSRPLFEGRGMARALSAAGVEVRYTLLSGMNRAMTGATKCVLGVHTVLANGSLQARAGSALVAMEAKRRHVPVTMCAETIKFSERVALDSIVTNEIAPEEELLLEQERKADDVPSSKDSLPQKAGKGKPDATAFDKMSIDADNNSNPLAGWKGVDNLHLLNIMYDVTPAEFVDIIITELGSLKPASSAAVQRLSGQVE